MRIQRVRLKGFKCYREESVLDLEAKVYAVTARTVSDADSSNWRGKSTLLEAITFALYGLHTSPTEDGWISRGEKQGEVEITFDDGSRIHRLRVLGKSTRIFYFPPKGVEPALQDEAQKAITEVVGLGEKDFTATCFFGQKQMSQLVTTEVAARMAIVSAWLRLEPLQRCEDEARASVAKIGDQLQQYLTAHKTQTDLLKQTLGDIEVNTVNTEGDWVVEAIEKLEVKLADLDEALDEAKGDVTLRSRAIEEIANRYAYAEKAKQYETVCNDGKELRAQVNLLGTPEHYNQALAESRARAEAASQAKAIVERDLKTRLTVARGEFDGKCPVSDIECPATKTINSKRKAAQEAYEALRAQSEKTSIAYEEAKTALSHAMAANQDYDRKSVRLQQLRDQAKQLAPHAKIHAEAGPLPDREAARTDLASAQQAAQRLSAEQAQLQARIKSAKTSVEALAKLDDAMKGIETKLATAREALVIFGKNGAQRRVAESALSHIEAGANQLLRDAGIDLELNLQWSREGQGLATTCESCGSPFPPSARVKTCARCNAERGAKLINRLEVALSARSGAAEDLAGGALQLSASAWLRTDRVSAWGVALIDEPFGALDRSTRHAFASHLTAMLRKHFEQAFVIAHTPDTVSMLPGHIEVVSDNGWSKASVVS